MAMGSRLGMAVFERDAMYSGFAIEMGEQHQRRGSTGASCKRSSACTKARAAVGRRRVHRGARARPHPRQDTSAFAVQHAAAQRNARLRETPIPQLPSHAGRRRCPVPLAALFVVAAVLIIIAIVLAVVA